MSDTLRLDIGDDGVAVITLARPAKLNIYNLEMRDALIEALWALHDIAEVRALVLAAEGKHFSAGADLSEFGTAEFPLDARRIRWDRDPWTPLWEMPVPSVVALHGYAVGAGLEMAMLCDLRYAAPGTIVGLPETTLGMLPAAGGTISLAKAIGADAALPVVLSGRNMPVDEAVARGIVHAVVDDVDAYAMAVARRIAMAPAGAVRALKRRMRAAVDGRR